MNSLRRGFLSSRRSIVHSRLQRRLYSEEAKIEPETNPFRTFMWMAGMGGFVGAAIYFIGAPDKEEDKNVKHLL